MSISFKDFVKQNGAIKPKIDPNIQKQADEIKAQQPSFSSQFFGELEKTPKPDYAGAVPRFLEEAGRDDESTSDNPVAHFAENVLGATSSGIGTVFSPLTNMIKGVRDSFFSTDLAKDLVENPKVKNVLTVLADLQNKYSEFAKENPEAARNIENSFVVGSTLLGGKAEKPIYQTAPKVAELAGKGIKTGIEAVGELGMKGIEGVQKAVEVIKSPVKSTLNVIEDIATPIPENVKKVLSNPERAPEVKTKLENYFNQGRKAIEKTGENTPLEIAGKTRLEEAMNSLNEGLKKAGESKRTSLGESGSKSGDISSVKTSFEQGLSERLGTRIDEFGNLVDAQGRRSIISSSPSDLKMVNLMRSKIDSLGHRPTLQKINDVVDSLQGELYKTPMKGAEAINSSTQGFVKSIARELNEIAKELGGDAYKTANQNYSRLIELKENLNSRAGDGYKNAGSIMKRVFSPTDAGIKDLIRSLETETGIPIFEDAVLAKFVMDTLGDQRAMSLLDKGALSSKGWLNKIIEFGLSRVQNPEGKAIRMVEKQIK